ncbi:MAG: hypothetical protein AB7Q29_11975 [Vicinamibacterales bacterium]
MREATASFTLMADHILRARIADAVVEALSPLPVVLAGWEGGSSAFGLVDSYSDIDLEFLVTDDASFEDLYASAENALEAVSPIAAVHSPASGRYYQLKDASKFLLVDMVFHRLRDPDHHLDAGRHGERVPLFDKGDWLRSGLPGLQTGTRSPGNGVHAFESFRRGSP